MNITTVRNQKSNNETTAAAHQVAQRRSASLEDNRTQRTIQGVTQLKTHGQNTGQPFTHNGEKTTVGKSMWVKLDPKDKLQGQSASVNTSQDGLMDDIRDEYGLVGNEVVKGHLLNDNLGGTALDNNLFPITGEANKAHLHNVESVAKDVYEYGVGLYYKVDVDSDATLKKPNSSFKVQLAQWDPVKDKIGDYLSTGMSVTSHLKRAKKQRSSLSGALLDKKSPEYLKLKKKITKSKNKKSKLSSPIKRVGDLSKTAKAFRDKQPMKFDIKKY